MSNETNVLDLGNFTPVYRAKPVYEGVKRILDIVLSLIGIIVSSPLLLVLSLVIHLEDGGPILYRAPRIGRGGRPISVYKFRSMRVNADHLEDMLTPEELQEYRINYKLDHDPRITRIGSFLRKTSMDELPQLFNILSGSLSLVGPRPVLQEETELYDEYRSILLSVKPGLTGLWQARGRSNITYEDGKRQRMELEYIASRSLLFDIKIIFWTVGAVLRMDGAQ